MKQTSDSVAPAQSSTTSGQPQNTAIPPTGSEGAHTGSMLYQQAARQSKHRYPDDYHTLDYYGQQPSFQSFPFPGYQLPAHFNINPTRLNPYGNSNPNNSSLQRHDNPRGREGDGPSQ